ncbi:hypothetical protein NDU88_006316 [Pleurodeles waltl]|uniref:Uncharacterized protein n=1 Tax=Pleurodeles waltl TaxID=8319 RepID=A0AAV7SP91_PLEWA|nr:hypothetical protein NDU88_006316 [Pleurodeles waltl]
MARYRHCHSDHHPLVYGRRNNVTPFNLSVTGSSIQESFTVCFIASCELPEVFDCGTERAYAFLAVPRASPRELDANSRQGGFLETGRLLGIRRRLALKRFLGNRDAIAALSWKSDAG